MPKINLRSSDNETFSVDYNVVKCSGTIRTMLDDLGIDDSEQEIIPIQNVNGFILKKVITWATYHKDDPIVEDDEKNDGGSLCNREIYICPWDEEFLKVDQGTLFELILAANFLDIKRLLDVVCKTVANMIKGKSPEAIRKTFNIKNDFTPEQEEQIRKENEWCEDNNI